MHQNCATHVRAGDGHIRRLCRHAHAKGELQEIPRVRRRIAGKHQTAPVIFVLATVKEVGKWKAASVMSVA